jgi:hypothetical protein
MQFCDTELVSKPAKNPKRVAAGKLNHAKRKGLSAKGRERIRQAAIRNRPWIYSTGPTSAAGKAQVKANGKRRQLGVFSVRELRADLQEIKTLVQSMAELRSGLA